MTKQALDNEARMKVLTFLQNCLSAEYATDVMPISANELTMPALDSEGNEIFVNVKVSIPRGTRNGVSYDPYDGYAIAEEYRLDCEAKVAEKQAKAEAAEAKKKNKRVPKPIPIVKKEGEE